MSTASPAARREYPERFVGNIQLPTQAPELAVRELKRS